MLSSSQIVSLEDLDEDSRGNSRTKVHGNYFFIAPAVRGFNIGTLTPLRFSVVLGGAITRAQSRIVTISLSPQAGAYSRVLKSEKLLSPPIPIGGGGGGGSGYK